MIVNLCLACRRVNRPDARFCNACGASLGNADNVPLPLQDLPQAGDAAGDAALSLTLRDVELPRPAPAAPPPAEELVVSGPLPGVPCRVEIGALPADPLTRRALKSERRATVRRARLRQAAAGHGSAPAVTDVLVLEPDATSRDALCSLLQMFGFAVHAADRSAAALSLAAARPLVAAFVGVDLETDDGSRGLDRCKRLAEVCRQRGGTATVLVCVASAMRPMDRIRAELAGCDEVIARPVTRGGVARALDARGIAMPRDARKP